MQSHQPNFKASWLSLASYEWGRSQGRVWLPWENALMGEITPSHFSESLHTQPSCHTILESRPLLEAFVSLENWGGKSCLPDRQEISKINFPLTLRLWPPKFCACSSQTVNDGADPVCVQQSACPGLLWPWKILKLENPASEKTSTKKTKGIIHSGCYSELFLSYTKHTSGKGVSSLWNT